MDIQSIGSTAQVRQVIADRNGSAHADQQVASSKASARTAAISLDTNKAVDKTTAEPSLAQVTEAVHNINKSLESLKQDLQFTVDSDSNRTVVKVVDQKTKEVIRQIPSEEALEIAKALDTVKGVLIRQKA